VKSAYPGLLNQLASAAHEHQKEARL